jgi:hypothetical protein
MVYNEAGRPGLRSRLQYRTHPLTPDSSGAHTHTQTRGSSARGCGNLGQARRRLLFVVVVVIGEQLNKARPKCIYFRRCLSGRRFRELSVVVGGSGVTVFLLPSRYLIQPDERIQGCRQTPLHSISTTKQQPILQIGTNPALPCSPRERGGGRSSTLKSTRSLPCPLSLSTLDDRGCQCGREFVGRPPFSVEAQFAVGSRVIRSILVSGQ